MTIPITFFAYNRPDKTKQVLAALKNQTIVPPHIIAFSDGAATPETQTNVEEVRALLRAVDWTKIEVIEREVNFGCAPNIVQGITHVLQHYEQTVIVEDDVLPARHFYEAMCILLDRYTREQNIFSVGGFPNTGLNTLSLYPFDVIISPRFSSWGWGTWRDRWVKVADDIFSIPMFYEHSSDIPTYAGTDLPNYLNAIKSRPQFYWDAPLALLCLYHNYFHVLTKDYIITNIGFDSGIHGNPTDQCFFENYIKLVEKLPSKFPATEPDISVHKAIQQYLDDIAHYRTTKGRNNINFKDKWKLGRIFNRIEKLLSFLKKTDS